MPMRNSDRPRRLPDRRSPLQGCARSKQHIPEVERRGRVRGIHLHHAPIETFGRCEVAPLFGGLGLFEDCISVVSRLFNFENELAGLVGAVHCSDTQTVFDESMVLPNQIIRLFHPSAMVCALPQVRTDILHHLLLMAGAECAMAVGKCVRQRAVAPKRHICPSSSAGIFCCLHRCCQRRQTTHPLHG